MKATRTLHLVKELYLKKKPYFILFYVYLDTENKLN